MKKLFEHIDGNIFKLSEYEKGTKLPIFPISKEEEMEAFQLIKLIAVPYWVERMKGYARVWNTPEPIPKAEDINKFLRKDKVYKKQGIIRAIRYATPAGRFGRQMIWFLIRKNRKGNLNVVDNHGETFDIHGKIVTQQQVYEPPY